jgi:hypothetical protein
MAEQDPGQTRHAAYVSFPVATDAGEVQTLRDAV